MPKPVKVRFVQINNSFSNSCYLPYAAGLLQVYFQKFSNSPESFEFLEPIYRRMPVAKAITRMEEVEIACFSTNVWNFRMSLEIARRVKENNADVLILFGGGHVPENSETFLRDHPFVDLACHGEGEVVFLNILENYHSRNWKSVPSVSYLENGNFVRSRRAPRIQNLGSIPSPYLEGVFDELVQKHREHQWLGLWETNRGCPFSCAYCDWGAATQSKLYTFDMGRLEKEIEWFAKNQIEFVFCCDGNFGILERDLEIAEFVARTKKRFGYPHALSVQNTKNAADRSHKIQKVLSQAGLNKGVTLALQTLDKSVLRNVGRQNISLKAFEKLQSRFNQDRVETYTDLILALPGESYDSFTKGVSRTIDNGQHNRIQFINLSILPNARMADSAYQQKHGLITVETRIVNIHGKIEELEGGIAETQRLVVGTSTMPLEDWVRARAFSWMTALLYFDKIMQIPFVVCHEMFGISYFELVEAFLSDSADLYPVITEVREFFLAEAKQIQDGGEEYYAAPEWLDMYWPHDEYVFIKLSIENKLAGFYDEARKVINDLLSQRGIENHGLLDEAVALSERIIKQPFQSEDIVIELNHNIWEFYRAVLTGMRIELESGKFIYRIKVSEEVWHSWEDWFREVVWYGNKKGAYICDIEAMEEPRQQLLCSGGWANAV